MGPHSGAGAELSETETRAERSSDSGDVSQVRVNSLLGFFVAIHYKYFVRIFKGSDSFEALITYLGVMKRILRMVLKSWTLQ